MSSARRSLEERQAEMKARNATLDEVVPERPSSYKESHKSPAWWARLWGYHPSIVRKLALEETEGVARRVSKATRTKRGKISQRIGDSAAQRIYAKLSQKPK